MKAFWGDLRERGSLAEQRQRSSCASSPTHFVLDTGTEMEELGLAPPAPTHAIDGGKGAAAGKPGAASSSDGEDLYLKLKRAQRQLEMLEIQVRID